MNDIMVFSNPRFGQVRTSGSIDEPIFCASDVCKALGYTNGRKAVADHCDVRDVTKRDTPTVSGLQSMTYVNESGLYALIFSSRLDQAQEFKYWVTSEVLPSIRKHGTYMTEATIEKVMNDPDSWITLLQTLKEERQQRKIAESKVAMLEEVTKEQAPKVVFADAVCGSNDLILIRDLAKLIQQNGVNIGEKRLYQWMRDNGYLSAYGSNYNRPMQRYVEQGLFYVKEDVHSENGVMRMHFVTKVTGKGQTYFVNKFLKRGNDMFLS